MQGRPLLLDGCFETVTRGGGAGSASWKQSSNSTGSKRTGATRAQAIRRGWEEGAERCGEERGVQRNKQYNRVISSMQEQRWEGAATTLFPGF